MRTIGVVTVARSDYSIYLPVLRAIRADSGLRLHLIATGMHLSPEFGLTVETLEADGFNTDERVHMLLASDSPEAIAKSFGLGAIGFAQVFSKFRPDILLVLGDRFEMFAAVTAALPFNIPIAHIHGGEVTEGAIDEAIRHSITKMSHLHFVSTETYGRRVIQMGEEAWRVVVSGAPSLDNLKHLSLFTREELEKHIGMSMDAPPLLVTFHPTTLEYTDTPRQIEELLAALAEFDMPLLFTYPNADTLGRTIIGSIDRFAQTHERAKVIANLGPRGYFSAMKFALAMAGNSSSGILEAASFELPVVNIGIRQRGRIHGPNVLDVDCDRFSIIESIQKAIAPSFRAALAGLENPYGDGHAAERILAVLQKVVIDKELLVKKFYDLGTGSANAAQLRT